MYSDKNVIGQCKANYISRLKNKPATYKVRMCNFIPVDKITVGHLAEGRLLCKIVCICITARCVGYLGILFRGLAKD